MVLVGISPISSGNVNYLIQHMFSSITSSFRPIEILLRSLIAVKTIAAMLYNFQYI